MEAMPDTGAFPLGAMASYSASLTSGALARNLSSSAVPCHRRNVREDHTSGIAACGSVPRSSGVAFLPGSQLRHTAASTARPILARITTPRDQGRLGPPG